MIRSVSRVFLALLTVTLLGVVVLAAIAFAAVPLDGTTITIDNESFALSGLHGWQVAAAIAVAVVAALLAAVVTVLVLVFALGCAALGVCVALLFAAVSLAMVASPVLLIAWLIWRLVRTAPALPAAAVAP